jgi:hypothetical protein
MPVVLTGYRELMQACNQGPKDTKRYVTQVLAGTGEAVRSDSAVFFASKGESKTAAGFKSTARVKGVRVYQRVRATTKQHPEYGALQMKVLWKASHLNAARTERLLEQALDKIAARFEQGP